MNVRTAFIAAPVLTLAYGVIRIIDGLDGSRGPGPAWTIGHLAFIGALVMFVVVFQQMRRMADGNRLATVLTTVSIIGAVVLCGQFAVDIVAGLMARDHAEMADIIRDVRTVPGVQAVLYDFGPYLFYVGQLGLVVQLAVLRRVPVWTPLLVLLHVLTPLADKDLIPVGAVVLLISYLAVAKRLPAAGKPTPVLV